MKGLCSRCRVEKPRKGQRYCLACHNANMREWRKLHPSTYGQKEYCRGKAKVYLKRGKLVRQPCEICGSQRSEMHHPDYSKPLYVNWFCHSCHLAHHRLLKLFNDKQFGTPTLGKGIQMSVEAMAWANSQNFREYSGPEARTLKLALLMLCDESDDGEGNLYPDLEHVAERSLLDMDTLKQCLKHFEEDGLLTSISSKDGVCYRMNGGQS